MERIDSLMKQEFVSVWVQDPQFHKDDFWHTHIDYEICLHTNSMCFRKKTSCVRRQYSEFVWLRQRLQDNAMLIELPKLPSWNPFFSLNNPYQVNQRMKGLQEFLETVLQDPLLLSDSRVHLFLQSQLSVTKMEACVSGQTRYTVAQAIQMCSDCHRTRFLVEKSRKEYCDSNCESTTSSGLGHSHDSGVPQSSSPLPCDSSTCENCDGNLAIRDRGFFSRESSCALLRPLKMRRRTRMAFFTWFSVGILCVPYLSFKMSELYVFLKDICYYIDTPTIVD